MKSVRHAAVAVGLTVGVVLTGCVSTGGSAEPEESIQQGGTLTFASSADMRDWNPLSAAGDNSSQRQMQMPMYPHPFLADADGTLELNDALLVSAEMTETEPMTVVYVIQDDAVWSDETPISADDFIYTQAVQDPDQCPDCSAAFTSGYSEIESVTGSEDGKVVTVVFETPFAQWEALFPFLLPAHIAAEYGTLAESFNEGFSKNVPAFSGGPFIIRSYEAGVSLIIDRNPQWYGDPVPLDSVVIVFIAGQGEQVTALQSGEVDLIFQNPSVDTLAQIEAMPDVDYDMGSNQTYYHMGMKVTGDVMGDAALRQAIYHALDVEDIRLRTIGQYAPDHPLMRSAVYLVDQEYQGVSAYRPNADEVGVGVGDTDAAIEILEDAGYEIVEGDLIGPDGSPVRDLVYLTYANDQLRMDIAQIAQQQLAEIGITLVIDAADSSRYSTALFDGTWDMMVTATALDLGPVSLEPWYGTDGARNIGFSDPEVDRLLAEAAAELDPERQVEIMNELDLILLEAGVVIPLFTTPQIAAFRDTFTGIEVITSKYGITSNINQWALRG
ncbi:MAG: ABC transporter family substrate-binding protein [Protaetiibacter sp.]